MLYNSEVCFVNELIANLKKRGIKQIPFYNDAFYEGVDSMSLFFNEKREQLGSVANEISMLFIKNPFENTYKRFCDAISLDNGGYMAFINPDYVIGVLDITDDDADYTIRKNRSKIPPEFIRACAEKFCVGAKLGGVS